MNVPTDIGNVGKMKPSSRTAVRARPALADDVSRMIARDFIHSGVVAPGSLLPSEKELGARYGVSRITVRSGLRTLRDAGLVTIKHGIGSVVMPRSDVLRYGLDRLCSIDTLAKEAGQEVTTSDVRIRELEADGELAARMGLSVGDTVLRVERVKSLNGVRVALLCDYVPEGVLPFDTIRSEFSGSVLDVLERHSHVGVDYADLEISPVTLDDEIAAWLNVPPGTAAIYITEVVFDAGGQVVEVGTGWHLQQQRKFMVRRRHGIGL